MLQGGSVDPVPSTEITRAIRVRHPIVSAFRATTRRDVADLRDAGVQAHIAGYGSHMERGGDSSMTELVQTVALLGSVVALVLAVLMAGLGL